MVNRPASKCELILVGGLGFVGRNIIETALAAPYADLFETAAVDDLSNACPGYEDLEIPIVAADYLHESVASRLAGGSGKPRCFVFLAGETRVAESRERPLDFIDANIVSPSTFVTRHVREGDHFILISTAGALFDGTFQITTQSAYCPKNFYGASKAAEEMILEKLVELQGATFSVVRFTNVFGRFSDKKKSAIHAFTRAAIEGREITINGDGEQTRDFIFSGDVARGVLTLARRQALGEPTDKINMLGSGTSVSLNDIVAGIERVTGKEMAKKRVPAAKLLATEPRDVIASPDDVRKLLGDEITSLQDGLAATYDYYRRRGREA